MNCRKCLCNDVCSTIGDVSALNVEHYADGMSCLYFKDKSRFIKLPNFVYFIDCNEIEKCKCLGFFKSNNELWLDTKSEREQILIPISDYNRTWFFKKSKAEARLKELNENG